MVLCKKETEVHEGKRENCNRVAQKARERKRSLQIESIIVLLLREKYKIIVLYALMLYEPLILQYIRYA